MKSAMWGLMFVAVVLVSNPGVDVSPSHTPLLALVMGCLALSVSWLAAMTRAAPVHSR
jgi:hypothetical protein